MGIAEFFAAAANTLISRYEARTDNITRNHAPSDTNDRCQRSTSTPATDSYIPATDVPLQAASLEPEPEISADAEGQSAAASDDAENIGDEPVPVEPETDEAADAGSRYRRLTKFAYEVQLEFQLSAFTQIAEEIADGNVTSFEEFAAAGFGLKAAMDFKGHQITQTDQPSEALEGERVKSKRSVMAQNATRFAAQSRNFNLDAFSDEAAKIKSSTNVNNSKNFSNTVKKFSLRYRMDNQFSFTFLNRFNTQTQKMAQTDPQNLDPYFDSAGSVAEKGTPEMMSAFFDAVDGYLDQAEEQLLSNAGQFFDLAVSELGLSGELVDMARDHLTGSIESFFTNVDQAVDMLESRFVPTSVPEPAAAIASMSAPKIDFYNPVVDEGPTQLAVA